MTRRWLIGLSIFAHGVLGAVAFVTGVWDLEKLENDHRASVGLAVMLPPAPPPEGGHAAGAPVDLKKKQPKKVAKEPVQPPDHPPTEALASATVPSTTSTATEGEGEGDGDGEGTGRGAGVKGGVDCALVGCAAEVPATPPPVPTPPRQEVLPPAMLGALRLSGDTQIMPPDTVKTEMMRDGRDRTTGVVKLCLDTAGHVSTVQIVGSTKYPAYDARLTAGVRTWRYRPHTVNGVPTAACGMVTFKYAVR